MELLDTPMDITSLRSGDADAFAELVRQFQDRIFSLCQSVGLRGADIDQAAADIFSAIYLALPGFNERSALSTWIYQIAFRTALRHKKQAARHAHGFLPEHLSAPVQSDALQDADTREIIWKSVAALGSETAMIVKMYYQDDLPLPEISKITGRPVGTIKTILFRARQQLSESLARCKP
jgi:RNA polymerase sigma-70 factor (ECF subfamily)